MSITKALELYKKDLEKIIAREEIKIQKEKDKQAEKMKAIFEEYPSENDVMNAFGWGIITERKKDQILDMFKNKDIIDRGGSASGLYIEMLKRDLRSIKYEINCPDDGTPTLIHDPMVEELEKEIQKLKEHNLALNSQVDQFSDRNLKLIDENKKMELELRELKENGSIKKHNERGAGRKSVFTDQEREMIKMYRIQGHTIKELAEMNKCSTGLIHKIINE